MCNSSLFGRWLPSTGVVLSLTLVLGIFISTALISLSELFILFAWLLVLWCGRVEQLRRSFGSPIVWVGMLLFCLMVLQTLFTSASPSAAWEAVGRYRELLLLPFLVFFLAMSDGKAKAAWVYYAFLGLMALVIVHSWGQFWGVFPASAASGQPYASVVGRIAGAIMLAFSCFAYLEEALKAYRALERLWLLWSLLFIAGCIALLFFFEGRTGAVIFSALVCLWGWRLLRWKGLVWGSLVVGLLLSMAYYSSEQVRERIAYSKQELYQLGAVDFSTFGDSRAEYYSKTLSLLPEVLPLGGGSGSFAADMAQAHLPLEVNFENPHNEYLLILYEQGVLGLLLLLLFFVMAWRFSNGLEERVKWLTRALVVTMAVGCMFNSLLLDNVEAHFYVLLLAALIGMGYEEKHQHVT